MDPTFAPFVAWCRSHDMHVAIVSDGLGLYVQPMLAAAGIDGLEVITNDWAGGAMAFPNGHPECGRCGTCKMLAVQRATGPVAFVGEGHSDRYGALYADLVFAKDALVGLCRADGVPFVPYEDFDDVRRALESDAAADRSARAGSVPWMASAVNLPAGLRSRPLALEDVDDVVAMVNRCELADSGETMWERADLLSDISAVDVDLERDWVGVFDGDRCVGWALFLRPWRAWVDVDPEARGRGIGTELRSWSEDRARELESTRVGQTIDDRRTDVSDMLRAAGYEPLYASWILRMDHPEPPERPRCPRASSSARTGPSEETELLDDVRRRLRRVRRTAAVDDRRVAGHDRHREGFRPDDMVVAADGERVVGGAFLLEADGASGSTSSRYTATTGTGASRARCCAPRSAGPTTSGRPHGAQHRLADRRAAVLRADRDARALVVHELGDRSVASGGRGIRTLGRVAPPHAFQACPFGRSGRPPPPSLRKPRRRPHDVFRFRKAA